MQMPSDTFDLVTWIKPTKARVVPLQKCFAIILLMAFMATITSPFALPIKNEGELSLTLSTLIDSGHRNNAISLLQHGTDNQALLRQTGIGNVNDVIQLGNQNQASISQEGQGNEVSLLQWHNNNRADIRQGGQGNKVNLLQVNDNNQVRISQFGDKNLVQLNQLGSAYFSVEQLSDNAVISITQY